MNNQMTPHIFSSEETSLTIFTSIFSIRLGLHGSRSRVNFQMQNYFLFSRTDFITYRTLEITVFSRVNGDVFSETNRRSILFTTIFSITFESLFQRTVNFGVIFQMIFPVESSSTGITPVLSCVGVNESVAHKFESGGESFAAMLTNKGTFPCVSIQVLTELARAAKALGAMRARVACSALSPTWPLFYVTAGSLSKQLPPCCRGRFLSSLRLLRPLPRSCAARGRLHGCGWCSAQTC